MGGRLSYVAAIDGKGGGDVAGVDQHIGWVREALQVWRQTGRTDWTSRSLGAPERGLQRTTTTPSAVQGVIPPPPTPPTIQPRVLRFAQPRQFRSVRASGGCGS